MQIRKLIIDAALALCSLRGVVEENEWPTLNGKKKLNDAILYSGNDITIEWFKIEYYKGNAIMGQAGNNFGDKGVRVKCQSERSGIGIRPNYQGVHSGTSL